MRLMFLCSCLLAPFMAAAQQPHQQEIQRALIELDQRGADFARGTPSPPLDPRVGMPLSPDPEIAQQLRPYERMRAAEGNGYTLQLPPPVVRSDLERPLPLPGGPQAGVDPVTAAGLPR